MPSPKPAQMLWAKSRSSRSAASQTTNYARRLPSSITNHHTACLVSHRASTPHLSRQVHTLVKQRLSTQFGEIRKAFREFDKDKSGNSTSSFPHLALLHCFANRSLKDSVQHVLSCACACHVTCACHVFTRAVSAKECTDALLSLNVNLPRKWLDHLVNVADYDRDGEINYKVKLELVYGVMCI